jgi:hypothetical protein
VRTVRILRNRLSANLGVAIPVSALVCTLMVGAIGVLAAQAKDPVGTYTGTWDGAGAGGNFELMLEKKDGTLGGSVSVTGEPTYKATLKTVSFDGPNMKALYDFPADERAEVALTATFDGDNVKGTWTLRAKDGGGEVASGGWAVKRK